MTSPVEIFCSACKADTLIRREPVYEGLKKVGERLLCASCGYEYPDEQSVPYKRKAAPSIFSKTDLPKRTDVFANDEKGRLCRYCRHYTVNPFTQRCGYHEKVVEATDSCEAFAPKPQENASSD